MTRSELLEKAKTIVEGHRDQDGREDSFKSIATYWSDYLNEHLTAKDVCVMMILLKIARVQHGHNNDDSLVDVAGYAACAAEYDYE